MNARPSHGEQENDESAPIGRSSIAEFAELNAGLIDTGCELITRLDDEQYARPVDTLSDSTIGEHVRHCLEFYEALLRGTDSGIVDYDTRPREALIESDRGAAVHRLRSARERIANLASTRNRTLSVRVTSANGRAEDVPSSLGRELETAASHTIHHYAVIAIFARARGVDVDSSFGVALSTRRYRAALKSC